MAGSQSFGKREKEKRKQAKRLEKQRRKEERQAEGTATDEEMIAWVDEFGNITDVPPEEREHKVEKVKLEDIVISTPKKDETDDEPFKGRVEYFNDAKGYGFIKDLNSGEKYFFHISAAPADIAEGQTVTFELEQGTRGLNAFRIIQVK